MDCTIRLRLVLKDKTKSDQKAVENIDGVKGAFVNSGQFQIIIGQGSVNSVLNGWAFFLKLIQMIFWHFSN